jgi:C4-dicarboxylate-specific signal transduction histidine kinase
MALAMLKDQNAEAHGWQALVKAVEQLATASDLDQIIAIVRATARDISGADGVSFVLKDGSFCHYVEEDAIGPLWKGRRFPLTACISGWCMLNNQPAVIPDIYQDPRIPHDAYRPTFVKSLVMVPVKTDVPVAAIGTYWAQTREFSADELSLIEALGRSTSAALAACDLRESLTESEHRLALALDAGGMGAWELNLATGEIIATAATKTTFGLDADVPLTRTALLAAVHPEAREAIARLIETGIGRDEAYRSADGKRRFEMRGRIVMDVSGVPLRVAGVVRDVTKRHEALERMEALRAELMRVARLNDLGAMASALAHELNQPLAAASNYLHAAERLMAKDPTQALSAITKAEGQFVRTKEIIQRIRGFVGQGYNVRAAEDIEQVCREVLELARITTRYEGVGMYLKTETGLPKVDIDKVQVQQVLLNLLRNAAEAMADCDKRHITITVGRDGDAVRLAVADTGPGLDPEIAAHLFQPFHTTKDGGMGVGLSLCRKIVEAQGGRIWHETEAPGATFVFTIPVAA